MSFNKLQLEIDQLRVDKDLFLKKIADYERAFKYVEDSIVRKLSVGKEIRVQINCDWNEFDRLRKFYKFQYKNGRGPETRNEDDGRKA